MPNKIRKHKSGFTMIELLVVATIIIVLSAVGLVSYRKAGESSRNAKRKADLEIVRQALVLYKADNGYYPVASVAVKNENYLQLAHKGNSWVKMAYAADLSGSTDVVVDKQTGETKPTESIPTPTKVSQLNPPVNATTALAYDNLVGDLVTDGYLTETIQDPKDSNPSYEYETAGSCGGGACSFTLTATLEPSTAGVWKVESP